MSAVQFETVPPQAATAEPKVLMRVASRVAVITLNRPAALNALSYDMVRQLATLLEQCRHDDGIVTLVLHGAGQKGFCAGGDVRALYQLAQQGRMEGDDGWLQFFVDEYRLDYALHQLPKPIVALMGGITMGDDMGLGQAAWLCVATEHTKMAMSETRIGFLPSVDATRSLSAMLPELELYVGLTGVMLTGTDALHCHLTDMYVPAEWLASFEDRLQRMLHDGDLMQALHRVFEPPRNIVPHASLAQAASWVQRYFDRRSSVDRIVATLYGNLEREQARELRQWLQATLDATTTHPPTMLHVTHKALLRGRRLSLAECFQMELGIVARGIQEDDFCEGVRAHLVDKDHRPGWAPTTLLQVRPERVRHFLTSPWRVERHPLARLR